MKVLVVGLGLIGGSFLKAFKKLGAEVFGIDKDDAVINTAIKEGVLETNNAPIGEMDLTVVCLYPNDAVNFIKSNCKNFKNGALVIDACGVKECVCNELFPLAKENGFTFIGGHPMAGLEKSGYQYSSAEMFLGASMILTPPDGKTVDKKVEDLFYSLGFGRVKITTAKIHDENIALTSQLAHVLSSAYVKSPQSLKHFGFSAGSFKDMTRVARLNEKMWAELFLDNKENLLKEINGLIFRLKEYEKAIETSDVKTLEKLLKEGTEIKLKTEKEYDEN